MGTKSTRGAAYYYAGGEKIELTPADDLFAVEGGDVRAAAGSDAVGRALTDGLRLVTKDKEGRVRSKSLYGVRFVPMTGKAQDGAPAD